MSTVTPATDRTPAPAELLATLSEVLRELSECLDYATPSRRRAILTAAAGFAADLRASGILP